MKLTEEQIAAIVRKVSDRLAAEPSAAPPPDALTCEIAREDGVFDDIDRCFDAAWEAYRFLESGTLDVRCAIIAAMRQAAVDAAPMLSRLAVEETRLGRADDKVKKNLLVATKTPGTEALRPEAFTGDRGMTLTEWAPYGVICSITPCTNPTETIICNAIGMVAAGNSVIFNPHPLAKRTSQRCVQLLNRAIVSAGGPPNLLSTLAEPTIETAGAFMKHPRLPLLVVTGGPAVVKAAMACGKKVIAAGPGNPPVVVDETADLPKAGRDIVAGASLDNNIICTDEKVVIAVDGIADQLKILMREHGAYELSRDQAKALNAIIIATPPTDGCRGEPRKEWIGQDAKRILAELGVQVDDSIRLVIVDVPADDPLVRTEQLMPVLPIVRVPSVDEGIALAKDVEAGCRHTASMWSRNIDKLHAMARTINTSIFVKNGPNYAGLGLGGEGFTSFTIASPTGEGLTCARHFVRHRRCTLVDAFRIV
ncbi:MAG: aldehyde dehydrogenase EutE [Verrucomicrobia bacterium]|nr:aldehyde dehydrogenase EutE [Verrucomicrobiota bacterium]